MHTVKQSMQKQSIGLASLARLALRAGSRGRRLLPAARRIPLGRAARFGAGMLTSGAAQYTAAGNRLPQNPREWATPLVGGLTTAYGHPVAGPLAGMGVGGTAGLLSRLTPEVTRAHYEGKYEDKSNIGKTALRAVYDPEGLLGDLYKEHAEAGLREMADQLTQDPGGTARDIYEGTLQPDVQAAVKDYVAPIIEDTVKSLARTSVAGLGSGALGYAVAKALLPRVQISEYYDPKYGTEAGMVTPEEMEDFYTKKRRRESMARLLGTLSAAGGAAVGSGVLPYWYSRLRESVK